jgi:hypothetical protein
MPDKQPQDKDPKDLTGTELGKEQLRVQERMRVIAEALGVNQARIPSGKTTEEQIKYLTTQGIHMTDSGGLMLPVPMSGFDHPETRKTVVETKAGAGTASAKLGDLADEFVKLQKRSKSIDDRLAANPSLAPAAKAAVDQASAAAVTPDPLAGFQPQFLDDRQVEDLARTGQFDITPQSIAAMFPSAELQKAAAQAQVEGTADPGTMIDKLAPAQYKDPSFVHTGKDFPFQPDVTQLSIQRIKDQGLPAWEETALINQLTKSTPKPGMTRDEYDAQRKAIQDKGLPWHEEIKQLNALKSQFDKGLPGSETRPLNAPTSRTTGTPTNIITGAGNPAAGNASLREVVAKPYGWTADQIAATATELFKAGYLDIPNYDPEKNLSQQMHITSAFDPNFQKAYQAWVGDSFKDRTKSMMDILKDRKDSYLPQLKLLADRVQAAKPKLTITLADSEGLRKAAHDFALQVTGHALKDDEYPQLISYIHGLQSSSQTQAYNQQYGPGAMGGTTEDVDVNARLEAAIRANHPVDAGAKDIADEADLMRSLFAGPV